MSKTDLFPFARICAGFLVGSAISSGLGVSASAQKPVPSNDHTVPAEEKMPAMQARGTFEVQLNPLPVAAVADGTPSPESKAGTGPESRKESAGEAKLGRMSIDKQFHGELEASSKGEMLTAMTEVKGSAGYVAIERVTGTLAGRSGTFILQHTGRMTRGTPELSVTVVPDSGSGQLAGLTGKMTIRIEAGGEHFYEFDYSLPKDR
jgi:hypothetical protein